MKINLNLLSIEVTRKCNLKCSHCLRGDAENSEIKHEYIDSLLNQISYIKHLTFTGGEPSLNVPAMQYFYYKVKIKNIVINSFAIPTNGIKITPDFVNVCDKFYDLVKHKYKGVVISNDIYHMSQKRYDDTLLQGKPYFKPWFDDWYDWNNGKKIQREGRGVKIKEAKNFSNAAPINSIEDINKSALYLNVNGEIINGIDWSYHNQQKHFLCRVENLNEYYNSLIELNKKVI